MAFVGFCSHLMTAMKHKLPRAENSGAGELDLLPASTPGDTAKRRFTVDL